MNFERPSYSVNEDEIRRMGAEKGWSDAEIDAKILSERAKVEGADAVAAMNAAHEAEDKLGKEFSKQFENNPSLRASHEKMERMQNEEFNSIPATPGTETYAKEQIEQEAAKRGWEDIDIGRDIDKDQEKKAA